MEQENGFILSTNNQRPAVGAYMDQPRAVSSGCHPPQKKLRISSVGSYPGEISENPHTQVDGCVSQDFGDAGSIETKFCIRLHKFLCLELSSSRSSLHKTLKLCAKATEYLEDDSKCETLVNFTKLVGTSAHIVKDQWIEKKLRKKLRIWLFEKIAEGGAGASKLDEGGQGVLHLLAALGYDWAINPILRAAILDVDLLDVNQDTALDWASRMGRNDTMKLLLSNGATPRSARKPFPTDPSAVNAIRRESIPSYPCVVIPVNQTTRPNVVNQIDLSSAGGLQDSYLIGPGKLLLQDALKLSHSTSTGCSSVSSCSENLSVEDNDNYSSSEQVLLEGHMPDDIVKIDNLECRTCDQLEDVIEKTLDAQKAAVGIEERDEECTTGKLISPNANTGWVTDPTPRGTPPEDLASSRRHKDISRYLAESIKLQSSRSDRGKAVTSVSKQPATPIDYDGHEFGPADDLALSLLPQRIKKAGHDIELVHAAAVRIQNKFRSWKGRKAYLLTLQLITKIQAHVRGHQIRLKKALSWGESMVDYQKKTDQCHKVMNIVSEVLEIKKVSRKSTNEVGEDWNNLLCQHIMSKREAPTNEELHKDELHVNAVLSLSKHEFGSTSDELHKDELHVDAVPSLSRQQFGSLSAFEVQPMSVLEQAESSTAAATMEKMISEITCPNQLIKQQGAQHDA